MGMIRKEWQSIRKNKILLISYVVICFIPILYAAFFLKSVWDPYGKTGNLPVAVVNNDKEVEYEGEMLHVGQDVVDELKEDDNLNWNFVSADEAQEGLKSQKYYMIVTIPEDFSANASTVMNENPKKMDIQYETNGALNYLGEVIGETAMKQLKSSVSEKVTETYANAIFDQLKEIGDGFEDAADGATQLEDGAVKITDGGQELADNLQILASSTVEFSDGQNTFSVGLNQYLSGVSELNGGITTLKDGVNTLGGKVPELAEGVDKLDTGSETLATGVSNYTAGVSKIADGTSALASNGTALKTGVSTFATGLSDGTTKLQAGVTDLKNGLSKTSSDIGTSMDANKGKIAAVQNGLTSLNTGVQGLKAALDQAVAATPTTATPDVSTELQGITGSTDAINSSVDGIKADATSLQTGLNDGTGSIMDAVTATGAYGNLTDDQKAELTAALQAALDADSQADQQAVDTMTASITEKADAIAASAVAVNDTTSSVTASLAAIPSEGAGAVSLATLKGTVDVLAANSATVLPGANSVISTLSTSISTVKTGLDTQVIPGVTTISNGLTSLQAGINDGSTKLGTGVDTYLAGVNQVNTGVQTLKSNSDALNTGASKLSSGLSELNSNIPALKTGVAALVDGTAQLKDGSSLLVSNNGTLLDGQAKLLDGSNKIADGSAKLYDGSETLVDALHTLSDGSTELKDGLVEGSDKVNSVQTSEKTSEMIAAPDTITQQKYSEVPNYGHALAPYVMSLALYVGCLVFNFIYPIRKIAIKEKSAVKWWLSKVSVGLVAAVAMAIIEGSIMIKLGLSPENIREFYAVAIITAVAYMFMIMFLAMAFDNPGRFVAMVLLILQLAGSGGTFPMPLTDKFFKTIHQYLPMTHSIYGFRQAISSGLGRGIFIDNSEILLGISIVSMLLLLVSMVILKRLKKDGVSQLDDNQKLLDDNYEYGYNN